MGCAVIRPRGRNARLRGLWIGIMIGSIPHRVRQRVGRKENYIARRVCNWSEDKAQRRCYFPSTAKESNQRNAAQGKEVLQNSAHGLAD